jgi:hypothetical protein
VRLDEVLTAGNVAFGTTVFMYAAGSVYSSVLPIVMSSKAYHDEDFDYYYYDDYDYHTYEKDDAMLVLGIQSSGFVVFGLLNQIAKGRQANYLRRLDATPANRLLGMGWFLYAASLSTMTLHLFSYLSDEPGFVASTALVNAAVQLTSFVFNVAGYYKQIGMLEQAAGKAMGRKVSQDTPRLLPYAGLLPAGAAAGLTVSF